MANRGGFSWKRAVGVTRVKQNISRATGIPLTKSGRQRKIGRMVTPGGGCLLPTLLVVLSIVVMVAGCATTDTAGTPDSSAPAATPVQPEQPKVDNAAVLQGLRDAYPEGAAYVTAVDVAASGSGLDVNIHTDIYPDSDAVTPSKALAAQALQLAVIQGAYPDATVSAYVWEQSDAFYMVRATVTYAGGRFGSPIDWSVNEVLK